MLTLTWLGQGGFLLESAGCRLVVDPYLSDCLARLHNVKRLFPPPISLEDLRPDVVFVTHDHLDHFDPETLVPLFAAFPQCQLVGPESAIDHGRREGFAAERLHQVAPGQTLELGAYRCTATVAQHSDRFAVGVLIEAGGKLLYISGDTLYSPALPPAVLSLASRPLDAALICINGKLNNMNAADAARVIAALRPRVAIPMHYGLFAENTVQPDEFLALCQAFGQATMTLEPGISVPL